jgi:hypothetical protein
MRNGKKGKTWMTGIRDVWGGSTGRKDERIEERAFICRSAALDVTVYYLSLVLSYIITIC